MDFFEDDFDNELNAWFGGVGEQRTILSGTWRSFLQQVCGIDDSGWQCVASWQVDDMVHYTMRDPPGTGLRNSLMPAKMVSLLQAVRVLAALKWRYENPVNRFLPVDYETPAHIVQHELWLECWQLSGDVEQANDLYDELGGEWKAS